MIKDIKTKNDQDLIALLAEKRDALRLFRFKLSGGKSRDVKEGRNIRRDIARILTILKERSQD